MRRYTTALDSESDGRGGENNAPRPVRYALLGEGHLVYRSVTRSDGRVHATRHKVHRSFTSGRPEDDFDLAWLNATRPPRYRQERPECLRLADLFCGAGGLTLGVLEAARAVGIRVEPVLGVDLEPAVERAYRANFRPASFLRSPIEGFLDGDPELMGRANGSGDLTTAELDLQRRVGRIDLVVGGPPCQGHSDLNNHTRRNDPKNLLYGRMARFARVFRPRHLLIENVRGAAHDRAGIMEKTRESLHALGYRTDTGIVRGERVGVPQTRHRIFMVASLDRVPDVKGWTEMHSIEQRRSFDWAQTGLARDGSPLDVVTKLEPRTAQRIEWLFANDAHELPNERRPECHRNDHHTYRAVYGRIRGSLPAPTITTGFTVMGQGRFVHPYERRTLTPREGARLQFFPNWFSFGEESSMTRSEVVSLIGNAVPPKMAYVLALELIR